jgi:protein gp37
MHNMINPGRLAKGLYWNDAWSLVEGCTQVSAGCKHCWAATRTHRFAKSKVDWQADRYGGLTVPTGNFSGLIREWRQALTKPALNRAGTIYAVWNDLFHEEVSDGFIFRALEIMGGNPQHVYVVLTKRPLRAATVLGRFSRLAGGKLSALRSVLFGTTVESNAYAGRLTHLAGFPEPLNLMLSVEPILGPVDLSQALGLEWSDTCGDWIINRDCLEAGGTRIKWVVVGCETGPHARPCVPAWVSEAVHQCDVAKVPVFVKSLPVGSKITADMAAFPESLQRREFPRGGDLWT